MSSTSWLADCLAHAYRSAEIFALSHADPLDARRAFAEHLRGAVETILIDRRVSPRTTEGRAIVGAVRDRAAQRAALAAADAGRFDVLRLP
jgi:hypothetical protein